MSTPIGHSLAGFIITGKPRQNSRLSALLAAVGVIGATNLPDIDFIFGYVRGNPNQYHHQWTHSLGFALLVSLLVLCTWRIVKKQWNLRLGFLTFMLVVSHLVIDLFTMDRSAPFGMQLLWPFNDRYYIGRPAIFMDVMKASTQKAFVPSLFCYHNLKTVMRECCLLIPAGFLLRIIYNKCSSTNFLRRSK